MDPKQRKRKLSDAEDSAVVKRNKKNPVETGPEAAQELTASFVGSGGVIHSEGLSQGGWIPKPMETVQDFKKRMNQELDCLPPDAVVTGGFAVVYEGMDYDRGFEERISWEDRPEEKRRVKARHEEFFAKLRAQAAAEEEEEADEEEVTVAQNSKTGAQPTTTNLPKMGEYETRAPAVPVQEQNQQDVWHHNPRIIQDISNLITRPPYFTRAMKPADMASYETRNDRRSLEERPGPGQRCGNCFHWGHRLIDCTFSPAHGAITGCPFCNTKEHNLDQCIRILVDISWIDLFNALLERRRGKCGIRTAKYLWMVLGRAAKDNKDQRFRSIKFDDRGPFPLTVNFVRELLKKYKNRNVQSMTAQNSWRFHWVWYDYSTNLPPAVDPKTEDWRAVEDSYEELLKTEEHGHIREVKNKAKTGLDKDVPAGLPPQGSDIAPERPQGPKRHLGIRP